jgi:microcystin-dependent protein
MAKFFVYPFASTVTNRAAVPDAPQDNGSISYKQGLGPNYSLNYALGSPALPLDRKQSNQVFYDITNNLKQYQTHGQPDFIAPVDNNGVPFPYEIFSHVRYDDGSGVKVYENQVDVNINDPTNPTWQVISGDPIPAGAIVAYAGATPPISDGYLVCDGSVVNKASYPFLFAAIGGSWGPTTTLTFTLPDLRRRALVGTGGTDTYGLLPTTLGSYGGTDSVIVTENQMAKHTHTFAPELILFLPKNIVTTHSNNGEIDFARGGDGRQTGSRGNNEAHPNIQQSAVINWIIKT